MTKGKKDSEFEITEKNPVHKRSKYIPSEFPEWFDEKPIHINTYSPDRPPDYIAKATYLINQGFKVYTQDVVELATYLKRLDKDKSK